MSSFLFYKQYDQKDCGPTCLRMIARHYGKVVAAETLNERAKIMRDGVSMAGIEEAAESIGFGTAILSIPFRTLEEDIPLPCIVYWKQKHFIVVYKIRKGKVYVADPAFGKITYSIKEFLAGWLYNKSKEEDSEGIVMMIEPTPVFFQKENEAPAKSKGLSFLIPYLRPHRKLGVQLLIGLLLISVFQLFFPFLTQSIVDVGILNQNLEFIYIVILAQLMLVFSQTSIQVIRDWIMLYATNKINLRLISDYLAKLMRLPLSYYDTKNVGDIMQRIQDNTRVQNFLSVTSLGMLFSAFTFVVFSFVLAYYELRIFLVFMTGSVLYFLWSLFFLKKRAEIDYRRFDATSGNQTTLFQLITGMPEIRLNGSEKRRRWEWEKIQVKLFGISMNGLMITQIQNSGSVFLNETKNVIIIFLCATLVIQGELTLGMMLSIQYIVGQLNVPVGNFVTFIQSAQDAKLSIKRLEEVYQLDDEEHERLLKPTMEADIQVENLSFKYGVESSDDVLKNVSVIIPRGKITAIVGTSGSGKTTLLKLLLSYYKVRAGKICIGKTDLASISPRYWRSKCGVVMQDGYLFSGTIEENITESDSSGAADMDRLMQAARIANIHEFIEGLPNSYKTVIGRSGLNLSGGEKQRILIARAVYKNPEFLFFDEATSALDGTNEKTVMNNLYEFFQGKTVIIIAHRLSTVRNASNIVVLHRGEVIENSSHENLIQKKGAYYELIKNQLELA